MESFFFQPNRQTWETSLRENRPIIFFFQEKLCSQCKIFEKSVIANPEIEKFLFENFIPISIDINEYPELYIRYSDTSHPIHTIHSVMGGLIGTCSSNSSPEQFMRNLKQLKLLNPTIQDFSLGFGTQPFKQIILDDEYHFQKKLDLIAEITLSSLMKRYDRMYGGWDTGGIKYHPSSALEFLFLLYNRSRDQQLLNIIVKTLRASLKGLHDNINGGFFEFSNRDWSSIGSHQKSLSNNIAIARNLLHAYLVNDDEYYLDKIHNILNFVFDKLYVEAYQLFRYAVFEESETILYNDIFLAKPNCDICSFLIEIKEIIEENMGSMYYYSRIEPILTTLSNSETEFGIPHMLAEKREYQYLLKDQTAYLELLLQLYSSRGNRDLLIKAKQFLEKIILHCFDPNIGLFKDRISFKNQDFGPLEKSLYPIRENATIIDLLVTFSYLSEEPHYREFATRCVTSYYSNFGISRDAPYPPEFVFANQRLIESPIELFIVGNPTNDTVKRMILEMKKIYDPFKIIQILDPITDKELINKKIPNITQSEKPAAFIKVEKTVSPPAYFPREISRMIHEILDAIKYDLD